MSKKMCVFIGTYTHPIRFGTGQLFEGKGKGIYCYELNMETGELTYLNETSGVVNPSYIALDSKHGHLYAVNELKEFEGQASGAVSAFSVDPDTYKLTFLNQKPTGGTDPCHVIVSPDDTHIFVSNFMSGSFSVFPVKADGSLDDASQFVQHEGSSINPKRQTGPHAHSTIFSPDGKYAFIPDLGMDKLMAYAPDYTTGKVAAGPVPYYATQPGSGPRHCVFHKNGKFCYLINELRCTISALKYNAKEGSFEVLQTVPSVVGDDGFAGENSCADIQITPNGKFVYGSNRGHDSIIAYKIDETTGKLTYVSMTSSGGGTPRNFAIEPTGRFLLVGNQDTDNILVFEIDQVTGGLTKVFEASVPTPVCIRPYRMG